MFFTRVIEDEQVLPDSDPAFITATDARMEQRQHCTCDRIKKRNEQKSRMRKGRENPESDSDDEDVTGFTRITLVSKRRQIHQLSLAIHANRKKDFGSLAQTALGETSSPIDGHPPPEENSETPPLSKHAAVSLFSRDTLQQNTAGLLRKRLLRCEFQPWTGCQQEFQLDEVSTWIKHAEIEHLQGNFPAHCICWFCDNFDYNTTKCPYAGLNFSRRMEHIAGHILDGYHFEQRRPDFHYLDHVYKIGKISPQAFEIAKGTQDPGFTPIGLKEKK